MICGGRGRGRRGGGGGAFGLGSILLLLLGVTWFVSSPVAGLKCYRCDDCGTSYKEKIGECDNDKKGCVARTFGKDGKWSDPNRGCGEEKNYAGDERCEELDAKGEGKGVKVKFCYCKTDLCNGDGESTGLGILDNSNGAGSGKSNGTIKKYPSSVMIFAVAAVTVIISACVLHRRI